MEDKNAKRLSYVVNTGIFLLVLGLGVLFWILKANIMVYFSIPTCCVYMINYISIHKGNYNAFIWLTYFWIIIYMILCTVCLGMNYGFHLYCMSLIPVIFVCEYMAYRLNGKKIGALRISFAIGISYLLVTGYVVKYGPIYNCPVDIMTNVLLALNAIIVFAFLISYSQMLLKLIVNSEMQLREMAHKDRLTGLYNRHKESTLWG